LRTTYGLTGDDVPARAEQRIVAILSMLAARLHEQAKAGSRFLVGDRLCAASVYWAPVSNLVRPLAHEPRPLSDDPPKPRSARNHPSTNDAGSRRWSIAKMSSQSRL